MSRPFLLIDWKWSRRLIGGAGWLRQAFEIEKRKRSEMSPRFWTFWRTLARVLGAVASLWRENHLARWWRSANISQLMTESSRNKEALQVISRAVSSSPNWTKREKENKQWDEQSSVSIEAKSKWLKKAQKQCARIGKLTLPIRSDNGLVLAPLWFYLKPKSRLCRWDERRAAPRRLISSHQLNEISQANLSETCLENERGSEWRWRGNPGQAGLFGKWEAKFASSSSFF